MQSLFPMHSTERRRLRSTEAPEILCFIVFGRLVRFCLQNVKKVTAGAEKSKTNPSPAETAPRNENRTIQRRVITFRGVHDAKEDEGEDEDEDEDEADPPSSKSFISPPA